MAPASQNKAPIYGRNILEGNTVGSRQQLQPSQPLPQLPGQHPALNLNFHLISSVLFQFPSSSQGEDS